MIKPILIPLLNTNEPEALLAGLHVVEGQLVKPGDMICTLETTKSTADVEADSSGYIIGLSAKAGRTVHAGEVLGYLADTLEEEIPENRSEPNGGDNRGLVEREMPAGLRITKPALILARQNNLDLTTLPTEMFITESFIRSRLERESVSPDFPRAQSPFDPTAIIIYGGGGHGKSVIELINALHAYKVIGVVDDGIPTSESILGLPVIGGEEILSEIYAQGVRLAANAVGGIGNIAIRMQVFQGLAEAGFACPALVHPTAYVEPSAHLSAGVQVFPHAYVGSEARLGYGCIVNTGAIVSHDCILEDYVNISPGAMLAGEVQIGGGVLVGMGTTINLRVKVGRRARIGNSSTVKTDVPEEGIVRAGSVWPE